MQGFVFIRRTATALLATWVDAVHKAKHDQVGMNDVIGKKGRAGCAWSVWDNGMSIGTCKAGKAVILPSLEFSRTFALTKSCKNSETSNLDALGANREEFSGHNFPVVFGNSAAANISLESQPTVWCINNHAMVVHNKGSVARSKFRLGDINPKSPMLWVIDTKTVKRRQASDTTTAYLTNLLSDCKCQDNVATICVHDGTCSAVPPPPPYIPPAPTPTRAVKIPTAAPNPPPTVSKPHFKQFSKLDAAKICMDGAACRDYLTLGAAPKCASPIYGAKAVSFSNWQGTFDAKWEGNIWQSSFPTLNSEEAVALLAKHKILIMGDSLARQLSYSFAHFLLNTPEKTIPPDFLEESNQAGQSWFDWLRKEPRLGVAALSWKWAPRLSMLQQFCTGPITQNKKSGTDASRKRFSSTVALKGYDVVVIALAAHDALQAHMDNAQLSPSSTWAQQGFKNVVGCLCRNYPNAVIIWRLAPYSNWPEDQDPKHFGTKTYTPVNVMIDRFNVLAQQNIAELCPRILVVDATTVLQPRSSCALRLKGNSPFHFNAVGRQVTVQLLLRAIAASLGAAKGKTEDAKASAQEAKAKIK